MSMSKRPPTAAMARLSPSCRRPRRKRRAAATPRHRSGRHPREERAAVARPPAPPSQRLCPDRSDAWCWVWLPLSSHSRATAMTRAAAALTPYSPSSCRPEMRSPSARKQRMPQHWAVLAEHIDAVRRYARGRDAVHADDLVQECLTRALARPGDWRDVRDARAYLLTILHNLHADEAERRWRDGVTLPIDEVDLSCAPEQFGRLLVRDLARSLRALPQERRRLLRLIALEGLSYRD